MSDSIRRAAWTLVDNLEHGVAYPYARAPGDEPWHRTRASLHLAIQSTRIDAMSDERLAYRTRLGLKL